MPIVTQQQLENACADAQSLSAVVNGASNDPPVVTRTGRSLPTVASVLAGLPQWEGDWNSQTTYAKGAMVRYGLDGGVGGSYLSIQDNNLNHSPLGNGSWWALIASDGYAIVQGGALAFGIITVSNGGAQLAIDYLDSFPHPDLRWIGPGHIQLTFASRLKSGLEAWAKRPVNISYNNGDDGNGVGPGPGKVWGSMPDGTHVDIWFTDATGVLSGALTSGNLPNGKYSYTIF